jgi:colanic acid/amylovoran biosynthesis glycosyltransferase
MSRLLLFTNDYPYATGDTVFVEKEIRSLAESFDDVVVFCHARDTSPGLVPMPANVRLGGNLFERSAEDSLWTPLRPRMLALAAAAAWRELVAGRLRGHVRLFLMGARVGITQARRRAVREAIAESPDTVAYAFWGMGGGLAISWLTGVRRRVVRLHGYDLYEDRQPSGYLPFRRFLLARVDRVLTVSEHGRRYLSQAYADPRVDAKATVSRLGVGGPAELRRPPRGRERVVVSCSAVIPLKRVPLIWESLSALHRRAPGTPLRWVHFGGGEGLGELERLTSAAGTGIAVDLRGDTPNRDVLRFYDENRVDAFVNLSTSEGLPVSIMEAVAWDIPVVATAVGGTPELVGPELGTGELVAADAGPDAVAAVLERVLEADDGTYHPRRVWEQEFDVEKTGRRAADLVRGGTR